MTYAMLSLVVGLSSWSPREGLVYSDSDRECRLGPPEAGERAYAWPWHRALFVPRHGPCTVHDSQRAVCGRWPRGWSDPVWVATESAWVQRGRVDQRCGSPVVVDLTKVQR